MILNSQHYAVLLLFYVANGERLHEQIYSSIEGGAACFRRMNGTHQVGCSSSEGGAVGVVYMLEDINDAQWLLQNATTVGPFVIVVDTVLFNTVIDLLLPHPELITGILLYENATAKATFFSQESRCPNEYSAGPGSQCTSNEAGGYVWNEVGTGLLHRDVPFPIFYLPQSRNDEINKIRKCYERYNTDKSNQKSRPLCSVQLNSFMYAAVNTEVCMRRSHINDLLSSVRVCDPLGDYNVYQPLFPFLENQKDKRKSILVTARMDTASLFDGVAPGAASSVVGMVTLITAAKALSDMISVNDTYVNNVLWTLLNGEAFDYIGSQRVAYDIARGEWPPVGAVTPSDIALHIDLGQIGGALHNSRSNGSWPLYVMAPYLKDPPSKVKDFIDQMISLKETDLNVTAKYTLNLPPSSLHSFRRILRNVTESGELPELLLVDHDHSFTNKFYHSALDEDDKIDYVYRHIPIGKDGSFYSTDYLISNGTMNASDTQVRIARLASVLSRALYAQATERAYIGNVTASAQLVDELLYCFLKSQECPLLMAADLMSPSADDTSEDVPKPAVPLYVGVLSWDGAAAAFAGHLLALLTGTPMPADNRTACDALSQNTTVYTYYYLRGWNNSGICVETTMNFSRAISPAFTVADYDLRSGEYSTWTESVWQTMWARVFVTSSGVGACVALGCGVVITVLAALATYWLHRHASVVFVNAPLSVAENDATTGGFVNITTTKEEGSLTYLEESTDRTKNVE